MKVRLVEDEVRTFHFRLLSKALQGSGFEQIGKGEVGDIVILLADTKPVEMASKLSRNKELKFVLLLPAAYKPISDFEEIFNRDRFLIVLQPDTEEEAKTLIDQMKKKFS